MFETKTVGVALLHCNGSEVVICRRIDGEASSEWGYPNTAIARGEDFYDAISRVVLMTTGLEITQDRFGKTVRDITVGGTRFVSARANMTADEWGALVEKKRSPCGTREVLVVTKQSLPLFIREKGRRLMIEPG